MERKDKKGFPPRGEGPKGNIIKPMGELRGNQSITGLPSGNKVAAKSVTFFGKAEKKKKKDKATLTRCIAKKRRGLGHRLQSQSVYAEKRLEARNHRWKQGVNC